MSTPSAPESMKTPCTTVLDEPVMILLWEYEDFYALGGGFLALQFVLGPPLALLSTGLAALGTYLVKRGKPPGALVHFAHRWELLPLSWVGLQGSTPQRYSPW